MFICTKHPTYKGVYPPKVKGCHCRRKYVYEHWADRAPESNVKVIAEKLGISRRAVRKHAEKLGLKPFPVGSGFDAKKKSFREYLIKGRTRKELLKKYGQDVDNLLALKHEDLTLFTQRDRYNQERYILLPRFDPTEVAIEERDHDVHVADPVNGLAQPYVSVQLPHFDDVLHIAPLFDVHLGHKAHRREKFLSYLRWIEETPNVYAILGGDLMENAIDDGRGMTYDQAETPHSQLDELTVLLAPIAHKILCSTTGN